MIPKSWQTFRTRSCAKTSRRVVHLELDGMRGVLEADHFRHLQVDVAVDEVVVEHAAGLEEGAVGIELAERLAERSAHGRDLLELGGRQGMTDLVVSRRRVV